MKAFNFAGAMTWLGSEVNPRKYAAIPATETAASDVPPSVAMNRGS
jgi:hypothetical protein